MHEQPMEGRPAAGRGARSFFTRRTDPRLLAYAVGPPALGVILVLEHLGLLAEQPTWAWVLLFVAVPVSALVVESLPASWPEPLRRHAQLAVHAAAVTAVIYLTGWGPELVGAFVFTALNALSRFGARAWKAATLWSLAGIAVGQLFVGAGWAVTMVPEAHAQAIALMGAFVVCFVVFLAAAALYKTERAEEALQRSERRFRSLVQNSTDVTFVVGRDGLVTYVSPAVRELAGLAPAEVVGKEALYIVHPDDRARVASELTASLQEAPVTEPVQFRVLRPSGDCRQAEAVVTDLRHEPAVAGHVVNLRDITERKAAEAMLLHQARHDPLTGLPNRVVILERAQAMLERARRGGNPVTALFLDLDNFKDINDTLGHEVGDQVLRQAATRFSTHLGAGMVIGRMGGDEFVVLAEGLAPENGPELLAGRVRSALEEPLDVPGLDGHPPLAVSISVGLAVGTQEAPEDLLREADIALYQAKLAGRDRTVRFVPEMKLAVLDNLRLRADLRAALQERQFFVLFQPVLDLTTLEVIGAEALLRWRHPSRGLVDPERFVAALEETGQIVPVGHWVLDQAVAQVAAWHRQGLDLSVAVNVSARQLEVEDFTDLVADTLARHDLAADSLVIEITESTLMRHLGPSLHRIEELKQLGVQVAIDDFGTGYSSLAYLLQFPVDQLKIDRSFVAAMGATEHSIMLVRTLLQLGHNLGLEVLAEGIESASQLAWLRAQGCERGQGYLFSPPVPSTRLEVLLRRAEARTAALQASTVDAQLPLAAGWRS